MDKLVQNLYTLSWQNCWTTQKLQNYSSTQKNYYNIYKILITSIKYLNSNNWALKKLKKISYLLLYFIYYVIISM